MNNSIMKKAFSLIEVSLVLFFMVLLTGIAYTTFNQSKDDTKYYQSKATLSALASFERKYFENVTDFSLNSQQIFSELDKIDSVGFSVTELALQSTDIDKISVAKSIPSGGTTAKFGAAITSGEYCFRLLLTYNKTDNRWEENISRSTTLTCSGASIVS